MTFSACIAETTHGNFLDDYKNRRSLHYATLCRKTFPGRGVNTEISPLRFASVEMTKVRAALPRDLQFCGPFLETWNLTLNKFVIPTGA
jgi:hypothetical protein